MAITTMNGAITGRTYPHELVKAVGGAPFVGVPYSSFYEIGNPPAASAPAPGMQGASLTSITGQIPFTNPASGSTYLLNMRGTTIGAGTFILADRLWHNSGIVVTSTGVQAVNSFTWPARDALGATNGVGVLIGVEVSSTMGAAAPTITLDYTNSAGTAGRTGTNIYAVSNSAQRGVFYPISLQDGDLGVRSIQNVTLSTSWLSGAVHLVAYRVIARIPAFTGRTTAVDWVTGGAPLLYDNSVPWLLLQATSTTNPTYVGEIQFTQG